MVARAIEARAIPTIAIMVFKEVAEVTRPPRAIQLRFPFGRPLGEPGNIAQQRVIIRDALRVLKEATEPGTLVALPYRWRREDYEAILKKGSAD